MKGNIKIGVGIMIIKDGKVLLGKRKGKHGDGEYAWPGGHLEYMESITSCAKREVMEETGMEIENIRFLRLLNNTKTYGSDHYLEIGLIADWKAGEPKNLEPERCEGWDWYDISHVPRVFAPLESCLEALKTGKNFFDN